MKTSGDARLRKGLVLGCGLGLFAPLLGLAAAAGMARAGYTMTANLTPSVPMGLYVADHHVGTLTRGQIVAFPPHNSAARYGVEQGWIKPGGAYIKRVAALAGDLVCVDALLTVTTMGTGTTGTTKRIGPVARVDRTGRPLPHTLQGCSRVPVGSFLPVGDGLPNSFDGRYFGFVPVRMVQARLTPVWTDAGTGH
jgi:signal peptidase I